MRASVFHTLYAVQAQTCKVEHLRSLRQMHIKCVYMQYITSRLILCVTVVSLECALN